MNFSGKSCKKCLISRKSTKNHRPGQNFATFRTNYHVFAFRWTLREKVAKNASSREKTRKTTNLAKTCNFSRELRCLGNFMNFSEKSCKKCLISWKSTRNHRFRQTMQLFQKTTMFLGFDELYDKKLKETASIREKARKLINLAKTMQLFRTKYHVLVFRWTFERKLAKSSSIHEKARKIIDLTKTLQLFEQTTMSLHFDELFRKKLQKVLRFLRKHGKSSIWPNLCNFSSKLPWFCISMKFSAKSYIKCLISWKSTKNRRFWRKRATSPTNFHVLTLWWTLQRKVAQSASFSEKTLKIIDWAKTCNFFEQSAMFMRLDELFSKRLQKVPRLVKKHEKSSIWQKLATFPTNYHVLAFLWTFQQKLPKNASFGEKEREIIDLEKAIQLFQQTTMFLHFDEFLRKRWEKVVHFVKKHENSWIWSKVATFWEQTTMF